MGTVWGYARVSTDEQDNALQVDALEAAGVKPSRIVEEKASGVSDRPVLTTLVSELQSGDTLTVWKLDRLGRSTLAVLNLIEELKQRGIRLVILTLGLDTETPAGKLMLTVIAAIATFERDQALERINAGIAAARARGQHLGRKHALTPHQRREAARMHTEEKKSLGDIAALFGVSRMCIHRAVHEKAA